MKTIAEYKDKIQKNIFLIIALLVFLTGLILFLQQTTNLTERLSSFFDVASSTPVAVNGEYNFKDYKELRSFGLKEQVEYWHEVIAVLGGEGAYEQFHKAYEGTGLNEQHAAAHVFGGELFKVEGVEGFSVCDLQYSYGCYHEFLGQAIFHEGMQVVDVLNQGCYEDLAPVGQELSCQHGIGHGVLAAIGYETKTLPEALEVCNGLPYSDPIGGCYGGVFMEYNLRTMLALDGVPPRDRESDDLREPCLSMPEYAQGACYYWQPQWWGSVLRGEGVRSAIERHQIMGDVCNQIEEKKSRDYCFKGIGNNLIENEMTAEEAVARCAAAAPDLRSEVLCRADAANSFFTVPILKDIAPELCDGLEGPYYDYCYAHSINKLNLLNQGDI